jgi:hypothetical protein
MTVDSLRGLAGYFPVLSSNYGRISVSHMNILGRISGKLWKTNGLPGIGLSANLYFACSYRTAPRRGVVLGSTTPYPDPNTRPAVRVAGSAGKNS